MKAPNLLRAAYAALEAGDRAIALSAVVDAWRQVRHPRIAEVVDCISDEMHRERREGKTAVIRLDDFTTVAQQHDPADLPQLLSATWPTKVKHQATMIRGLVAWPDDPRLAIGLARLLDEPALDRASKLTLFRPVFQRLATLGDLRVVPALRAQESRRWSSDGLGLPAFAKAIVEQLEATPLPDLTPEVDAPLAELEACFAARIQGARERVTKERALLTTIYERADDIDARAVYADWLTERADPRGEFIALQLARSAGRSSPRACARERELLEKYGSTWAGALEHHFVTHHFEDGFLAGGELTWRGPVDLDLMLRDPAWRIVRLLASRDVGTDRLVLELLDRPELAAVRAVHGVLAAATEELAAGKRRSLVELVCTLGVAITPGHPLEQCNALPTLRVLGLDARVPVLEGGTQIPQHVERLVIRGNIHAPTVLAALESASGALREVMLGGAGRSLVYDEGWTRVLERNTAPGPFTRLVMRFSPHEWPHTGDLFGRAVSALHVTPAGWLRELEIDAAGRRVDWAAPARDILNRLLARQPLERVTVPWKT